MTDGKIILILGKRGEGKTLLAQALFNNSKKTSVYISPRLDYYYPLPYFYTVKEFKNSELTKPEKAYFTFATPKEFDVLLKALKSMKRINIFVDEITYFVSSAKVNEYVQNLIYYTRPQQINLIFISMRPQNFNPLLISQTDLIIAFKLQGTRDIDYLNNSYSYEFNALQNLNQFEFYVFSDKDRFDNLLNNILNQ